MIKLLARFLCAFILFAIPAGLFAASDRDSDYYNQRGWKVEGTVVSVNKNDKKIDIYDNRNRYYSIDADDAKIYEDSRSRSIKNIEKNDRVLVYGDELNNRNVKARTIYILSQDDYKVDRYDARFRVNGQIRKIDRYGNRIDIKAGKRTMKIIVNSDTRVYSDSNRKIGIRDLDEGDTIVVTGYRGKGNDIIADEIRSVDRYRSSDNRYSRNIQAKVVKSSSIFDRTIRVSNASRNERLPDVFDVEIASGVQITRNGDGISVHDIRTGDYLDMTGYWNGSSFIADRVRVNDDNRSYSDYGKDRDYRSLEGTIRDIDTGDNRFDISTDNGRYTVYADRARIWRDGDVIKFSSLRRGDRVLVRGNINDKTIDAEIVEVTR